jgi:hypothetical protein
LSVAVYNYKKQKRIERIRQHAKLANHLLFSRIQTYTRYLNTKFELKNRGKQKIWSDILTNYYLIFEQNLKDLAEEVDAQLEDEDSCPLMFHRNIQVLEHTMEEFNSYYMNNSYTLEEQKILNHVLPFFNKWNYNRIAMMQESIREYTQNDEFYPDCFTKQVAIFDAYLKAFADTLADAAHSLHEVNGYLDGKVFKGERI